MTPLTPEERQAIIAAHPNAAPGEIDADILEYERLVAEMFSRDPSRASTASNVSLFVNEPASRLRQLHVKLFGDLKE